MKTMHNPIPDAKLRELIAVLKPVEVDHSAEAMTAWKDARHSANCLALPLAEEVLALRAEVERLRGEDAFAKFAGLKVIRNSIVPEGEIWMWSEKSIVKRSPDGTITFAPNWLYKQPPESKHG